MVGAVAGERADDVAGRAIGTEEGARLAVAGGLAAAGTGECGAW